MSIVHTVARATFRGANRFLNPLGAVIAVPDVVHGSPAFTGAPMFSRRMWDMAHYFDLVKDVDGDVVEAGVHWGYGLLCFLHLTRNKPRMLNGFDSFSGHSVPVQADKSGGGFVAMGSTFAVSQEAVWRTLELGTGLTKRDLQQKIQLHAGWINDTMPKFAASKPKIALVHLDPDLYEPCRDTLAAIWPVLATGGVVICGRMVNTDTAGKGQAVREHLATLPPGSCDVRTHQIVDTAGSSVEMTYLVKQ